MRRFLMSSKTEATAEIKAEARRAEKYVKFLQAMIEEQLRLADKPATMEDFENPNWALTKAYQEGAKKVLTFIEKYGIIQIVNK